MRGPVARGPGSRPCLERQFRLAPAQQVLGPAECEQDRGQPMARTKTLPMSSPGNEAKMITCVSVVGAHVMTSENPRIRALIWRRSRVCARRSSSGVLIGRARTPRCTSGASRLTAPKFSRIPAMWPLTQTVDSAGPVLARGPVADPEHRVGRDRGLAQQHDQEDEGGEIRALAQCLTGFGEASRTQPQTGGQTRRRSPAAAIHAIRTAA